MIRVVYHKKYNRVTVNGHARSDEYGRDLVCASVTALVLTLAENVQAMAGGGYVTGKPEITLEEGRAEICCTPVRRFKAVVTMIFDAVCLGLEKLAQAYPEYVQYEIMN